MKMIQVRNVPDEIHRELKIRAAREGVSLSEYLLELARRDVARPSMKEMLERLRAGPGIRTSVTSAELIRDTRDAE